MIWTLRRRSIARATVTGTLLMGFVWVGGLRGDDLTTLAGVVYHDVRPVRVEPDGVTWQYDEGIAKVDFTDCPKKICQDYHYDPAKAAAYKASIAQARQQADEQSRLILQQDAQRRATRAQAVAAQGAVHPSADMKLVFQRAASPAASEATRALGEQMDAIAAKQAFEPTGAWGVIAHSRVGSILSSIGLVRFNALDPIANKDNPAVSSQSVLSSGHAAQDVFEVPEYSTRRYYDEMDRAAAFARGVPLKPSSP